MSEFQQLNLNKDTQSSSDSQRTYSVAVCEYSVVLCEILIKN